MATLGGVMGASKRRRRIGIALALVLAGCAALAALARAVVIVYTNNFDHDRNSQALERSEGKHCARTIKKGSLVVTVKRGPEVCGYYLPVLGDAKRPDLDIQARVKLQKPTSKRIKKHVFVGVAVRSGPDTRYEFRVFPKGGKFLLKRSPREASFNTGGRSKAIKPLDSFNRLELQVFGRHAKAYVNGKKVADVKDANPDDVKGRRTELVVGNLKKAKADTNARIDSALVGVPNVK
jgi:hypothetical protein